jgi:hypothetical protein
MELGKACLGLVIGRLEDQALVFVEFLHEWNFFGDLDEFPIWCFKILTFMSELYFSWSLTCRTAGQYVHDHQCR